MTATGRAAVPARRITPTVTVELATEPETFHDFVMRLAGERGLTSLAEIGRAAGADRSTVSRWLSGANGATVQSLRQLADALDIRLAELMVAAGLVTAEEIGLDPLPDELQGPAGALRNDAPYTGLEREALLVGLDYAYRQWLATIEVYRNQQAVEPSHEARSSRHATW